MERARRRRGGRGAARASPTPRASARSCSPAARPASTSTRSTAPRPPARCSRRCAPRGPGSGRRRAGSAAGPPALDSPRTMAATEGSFRFNGHRIAYADYGEGERVLVLAHGLLMNRHMYDNLAPEMASRGFRVITVDLLGHGASDKPTDMRAYSMPAFGDQLAALIDHLELDRPIVGGTSLGANATLEMATRHPRAARGAVHRDAGARQRAGRRRADLPADPAHACGREAGAARRRDGHQPDPALALPRRPRCSTGPGDRPSPPRRCSRASSSAAPRRRARSAS